MSTNLRVKLLVAGLSALLVIAVLWKVDRVQTARLEQTLSNLGLVPIPAAIGKNTELGDKLRLAYKESVNASRVSEEIAYLYHANGYYTEAISVYKLLADASRTDHELRYLYALAASEVGNQEIAISELGAVANVGADNSIVYLRLGDLLLKQQRLESSITAYHELIDRKAHLWHAFLGLAQTSILKEEWETAEKWLIQSIEVDDSISTPYTLLGLVYGKMSDSEGQSEALRLSYLKKEYVEPVDVARERLLLNYCFDSYQLMVAAEMAQIGGRFQRAKQFIQRVEDLPRTNAAVLLRLGEMLIENEPVAARKCFLDAIEIDPYLDGAYVGVAETYHKQGQLDRAVEEIENATEFVGESSLLFNWMGEFYLEEGRLSEALASFEKAHELNPTGVVQMRNLGMLFLGKGSPQGTRLLTNYLEIQPDDQKVALFLGRWLVSESSENDTAIRILERTRLSVAQVSEDLQKLLASAYHQKASKLIQDEELELAAESLENSLSVWPENLEALANLGMIHSRLGQHDKAEAALLKFALEKSENAVAWANLGKARLMAGRLPDAIEAWNRGLIAAEQSGDRATKTELTQLLSRFRTR